MGLRDKLQKYDADNYMKKYGDRITQALGGQYCNREMRE